MEDRQKYDLLKEVAKVTMPVLMIVGDEDDITPAEHQQIFYDKLQGEKEFHIIKGVDHNFRKKEHLDEIKEIMKKWIERWNQK